MREWETQFGDRYPIVGNEVRIPNKSIILFIHGDDLNSLKNINAGFCGMIQAEEMCEDDFWFLNARLRRQNCSRQLKLECNYDGHNWIYKVFDEKKTGTLITSNTFDNQANLPPDYIPNLKLLPKKLQERHLYGSDADMEGLVFDEFSMGINIIAPFEIPVEWNKIVGLDYGVTNPTAVLFCAVDWDGRLFIFDEHYESGKIVSYHAEKIKDRGYQNIKDYLIDPSCRAKVNAKAGQFYSVIDEYMDNGINFTPANNSMLAGINRVNTAFKDKQLFIFKNCVNTIREVSNWKWKKLKPGIQKNEPDEPENRDDHTCDALRYIVMSRPLTSIPDTSIPIERGSVADFMYQDELMVKDWKRKYN
jgi:PBSX family phage terminase large subunit